MKLSKSAAFLATVLVYYLYCFVAATLSMVFEFMPVMLVALLLVPTAALMKRDVRQWCGLASVALLGGMLIGIDESGMLAYFAPVICLSWSLFLSIRVLTTSTLREAAVVHAMTLFIFAFPTVSSYSSSGPTERLLCLLAVTNFLYGAVVAVCRVALSSPRGGFD